MSDQDIDNIELTRFGCFERGTMEVDGRRFNCEEKWLFRRSNISRVDISTQRGKLTGLEVQTDQHCILITNSKIRQFARKKNRGWRLTFSDTPPENCWQPTRGEAQTGWQIKESVVSR